MTKIVSVREYLSLINETLGLIPSEEVVVEGELSEVRISQDKWINLVVKDASGEGILPCFATVYQVKIPLVEGMTVRVSGTPKVFERFGKFTLNVRTIECVGEGGLKQAYEALKRRLEAEGLFDHARKRVLPRFPSRVGIITSREAAAYTDVLRVARNRWSGTEIVLAPVYVQGEHAVSDILGAFTLFQRLPQEEQPEVIILTRGGGSLEDLLAFNDESVARAVFASRIPVVCAVGHERDESLCDFVADVRASTPSNAAERVFPDRVAVLRDLLTATDRMESQLRSVHERHTANVRHALLVMVGRFDGWSRDVADRREGLARAIEAWLLTFHYRIDQAAKVLTHVDPTRVLKRGYSLVFAGDRLLSDPDKLEVGESVRVQLARGSFDANVSSIESL